MIPLSDASRRPQRFPIVTTAIILTNALVFLMELTGGEPFIRQWSVIPADISAGRHVVTLVTAMFMHAGWLHIVGNMVFLWAFGPEIEEAMGRLRYAAFYLLGGLAASAAQIAAMPGSTVPNLGASGAIAAVMGAFLITYPRDQIRTLIVFGFFIRVTVIPAALYMFWHRSTSKSLWIRGASGISRSIRSRGLRTTSRIRAMRRRCLVPSVPCGAEASSYWWLRTLEVWPVSYRSPTSSD